MRLGDPNNVGSAARMEPILVRYASQITEQKKCWEFLTQKFDHFQTSCNKACKRTQHVTPNNVGTMLANNVEIVNIIVERKMLTPNNVGTKLADNVASVPWGLKYAIFKW